MSSEQFSHISHEERELNCIFTIEEILKDNSKTIDERYQLIIEAIPSSMNFPENADGQIIVSDKIFKTHNFKYTPWVFTRSFFVQNEEIGSITIAYHKLENNQDFEPFLQGEKNLILNIASRLENFILYQELQNIFSDLDAAATMHKPNGKEYWETILETIRRTDPPLFMSFLRKILHILSAREIEQAKSLLDQSIISSFEEEAFDENTPTKKKKINTYDDYIKEILQLARENIEPNYLRNRLDEWLLFNKSIPLIKTLESDSTSLTEISLAIRKYFHLAPEKIKLTEGLLKGLRVALIRRFFTDNLQFISSAKEYVKLNDFYNLITKMIYMPTSHGKLGGKSSGLFVANTILRKKALENPLLQQIKTPKTWYIASDSVLAFMHYNELEELQDYKYKNLNEIKMEHFHVIQMFKNASFPPELEVGLSSALDDLGDVPLIVRSSSLLEDQVGSSFSGKYKSLFLPNQGTKTEKLNALKDAIAEVFSSTFGPDPIEYRSERSLLDFHEEMAVMIQEVVGNRIGKYYLPSFAGVAFSNNEFRWSQRIRREDGLVRIVPGLGTRAVDRVGDDYPILVSPGQPNLRVNVTVEEAIRYSPKFVDVINLETHKFDTISFDKLISEFGDEYPALGKIVSIYKDNMLREPIGINTDYSQETCVVTFDGIFKNQKFLQKIDAVITNLQSAFNSPVDIEFAHDGTDLYLLQCRPQNFKKDNSSIALPEITNQVNVLFETNKFVSNGFLSGINYVVYVDPILYSETENKDILIKIGEAISRLNKVLPRREFILIGPGRWGSRGDIKLGVRVTYSDINNTAMLIEVAKKKGSYTPDLSFGTHFFQDLVEASISYLPLYPDETTSYLNEEFLLSAHNSLMEIAPEYESLSNYIHVVKLPYDNFKSLEIFMNADESKAIALFQTSANQFDSDEEKEKLLLGHKLAKYLKSHFHSIDNLYLNLKNTANLDLYFLISDSEQLIQIKMWLSGFAVGNNLKYELNFNFYYVDENPNQTTIFDNLNFIQLF